MPQISMSTIHRVTRATTLTTANFSLWRIASLIGGEKTTTKVKSFQSR